MKNYIKYDPWKIIEEGFNPDYNKISESICSLGNGKFGQRANFEESFSGKTLQGNYVSGVYYPDKTRVGWWKNGYPEYFAKMLNAPSWIGIKTTVQGEDLDLNKCEIQDFSRVLDMKKGVLERRFTAKTQSGKIFQVVATRFLSVLRDEIGAIKYTIIPKNFSAEAEILCDVDADIKNEDSNYDEKFWIEIQKTSDDNNTFVTAETKKTQFQVCTAVKMELSNFSKVENILKEKYAAKKYTVQFTENEEFTVYKYAAVTSTMYYSKEEISSKTLQVLEKAYNDGFEKLLDEQI
ncbi:MAG: glycoside hydrolase family 65 protein, partial [Bacteroidales bacterium]|nr:glycoside hydrolase family 65 protein [Bacteroidales bacterium]